MSVRHAVNAESHALPRFGPKLLISVSQVAGILEAHKNPLSFGMMRSPTALTKACCQPSFPDSMNG